MARTDYTLRQLAGPEQVAVTAAHEFVRLANDAVAARGRFSVALSGGSTPRRLYQLLADKPFRDQIDWNKIEIFWGDERGVPPTHPDSNYRMAREALLDKVPIPAAHIHRMAAEREDRDAAARNYQAEIARVEQVAPEGEPPPIDLVLLGMGPDGHTASLFPGTSALHETARWVIPNFVPKFNAHRMTLTTPILNRAAQVMFLVVGPDKAAPLAEVLEGPPDPERLPSQLIRPGPGRLLWLVDSAAASRLKQAATP
jgi:6-phosphogluconolactonase